VPSSPPHDARIRAAVLADAAMSFAFTPEALAGIQIPLQIWRSEQGGGCVGAPSTENGRMEVTDEFANPLYVLHISAEKPK
jgi:predicted dienelactone hydrolase